MRYRLGSFSPRPGSSDFANLHTDPHFGAPITRALEGMLRVRLSREGEDPRPDLLEALGQAHPDRSWVESVRDRMESLKRRGLGVRLLACEHEEGPDGFLTIAASAPDLKLEVLPGDWMQVGFAVMRDGSGPVRAWPRLLREVCANGSLVCVGELERHEGAEGTGEAIERFLDPARYEAAVEAFRAARATAVPDPREYLDEMGWIGSEDLIALRRQQRAEFEAYTAELEARLPEIEVRFEEEGDGSLYGLVNALTATARDVDDWPERLALEELAGSLAVLRRPVPRRSGGAVLTPA